MQQAPTFSLSGRRVKESYEPFFDGKCVGAISLRTGGRETKYNMDGTDHDLDHDYLLEIGAVTSLSRSCICRDEVVDVVERYPADFTRPASTMCARAVPYR